MTTWRSQSRKCARNRVSTSSSNTNEPTFCQFVNEEKDENVRDASITTIPSPMLLEDFLFCPRRFLLRLSTSKTLDLCHTDIPGGRWVDSFLVGCDVTLPDSLVLNLLEMMDRELIRLAQDRRYDGIVTVNSHPVTAVSEAFPNWCPALLFGGVGFHPCAHSGYS